MKIFLFLSSLLLAILVAYGFKMKRNDLHGSALYRYFIFVASGLFLIFLITLFLLFESLKEIVEKEWVLPLLIGGAAGYLLRDIEIAREKTSTHQSGPDSFRQSRPALPTNTAQKNTEHYPVASSSDYERTFLTPIETNTSAKQTRSTEEEAVFEACLVKAKVGDLDQQHQLGMRFLRGRGTRKSLENAVIWLNLAARRGNTDSQLVLGSLYARGEGVELNRNEAYFWLRIAAREGNEAAQLRLSELIELIPPQQKDALEERIWRWRPRRSLLPPST